MRGIGKLAELIRGMERKREGYSRAFQAARVRASYQRAYFAPALFNMVPVQTDQIASMAVDAQWRLYYNDDWLANHTVEENAAVIIHEVCHLLRAHNDRKHAAAVRYETWWNTAADCEINDDLFIEGLPLPDNPPHPGKFGMLTGENAETYYRDLVGRLKPDAGDDAERHCPDCGSGAHGGHRPWELPADDGRPGGTPGVDKVKAEMVRRDVAHRILDKSNFAGDVSLGWKRWARTLLKPKVDYMATIRHVVRKAMRDCTLGRYDRSYARPHRRQAAYGDFIMSSFHQPRPRAGFLIDTSASMEETQLARAVAELGGLTRQLGYAGEVVVACCDVTVHDVRKVFNAASIELYGGGGTDIGAGIRFFAERQGQPIDLLVIVSDCQTPWPEEAPPFPVVTIRVGDGPPAAWAERSANKLITIEDQP